MILIIQNGYIHTNIGKYLQEEYELVKSYYLFDVDQIDLDKYSFVIILGGDQSLQNIKFCSNLQKVLRLIEKCLEIKKPVLGICLGCQLIAYFLGCEIKSSDNPHCGFDTEVLDFKYIFRCHYDYIVPNEKIDVLDTFHGMPYLFRHQNLLGVQCHPDIPPENIIAYQPNIDNIDWIDENKNTIDKNNEKMMKYLIDYLIKN